MYNDDEQKAHSKPWMKNCQLLLWTFTFLCVLSDMSEITRFAFHAALTVTGRLSVAISLGTQVHFKPSPKLHTFADFSHSELPP